MKKVFVCLPFLMTAFACSNDFDVTDDWKDIPVVYGILAASDTAHYIRVEKAFLDPNQSAYEIAQIADSLYYDDSKIGVFLEKESNSQRVKLARVDGTIEGFPRKDGIFAQQPNWLYKYKSGSTPFVVGGEKYKLVLERGDNLPTVTASTTLPTDFTLFLPSSSDPKITFTTTSNPRVEWRTDINGVLFAVQLNVRYREVTMAGTFVKRDTLLWNAVPNVERTNTPTGQGKFRGETLLSSSAFFSFLQDNIPVLADRLRFFEGCDIILTGGGAEIKALQNTISANSGIVGAESVPLYTNLSEGFGVFTGRNTNVFKNFTITDATVDSMNDDPELRKLNFR